MVEALLWVFLLLFLSCKFLSLVVLMMVAWVLVLLLLLIFCSSEVFLKERGDSRRFLRCLPTSQEGRTTQT